MNSKLPPFVTLSRVPAGVKNRINELENFAAQNNLWKIDIKRTDASKSFPNSDMYISTVFQQGTPDYPIITGSHMFPVNKKEKVANVLVKLLESLNQAAEIASIKAKRLNTNNAERPNNKNLTDTSMHNVFNLYQKLLKILRRV